MAVGDATRAIDELARRLQAVEPGALLVSPRVLRRVIRLDRDLPRLGLRVPHRRSYVVDRAALMRAADAEELGLPPGHEPPEVAVLIERPEPEALAAPGGMEAALLSAWRRLFHARVHRALEHDPGRPLLDRAAVRERIERVGHVAFDEVRSVLRHEGFLLPPKDDRAIYVEFAAVYLELRQFAFALVPAFFPGITDHGAIDRMLAEDVDADALYHATRPAGAPEPPRGALSQLEEDANDPFDDTDDAPPPRHRLRSAERHARLMAQADRKSAAGNVVRAAILRSHALPLAPAGSVNRARAGVRRELDRLAERLAAALDLGEPAAQSLRRGLGPLLARSRRGLVTREARLLYDLQKVCVDHERAVSRVDLVEWALSFGRRPIVRPLPHLRDVLVVKHLRQAQRRLSRARIDERERHRLGPPLRDALHAAEAGLRDRLRPVLEEALRGSGLEPRNVPERVALAKLVEELLDGIARRGYINMGDLRDGLARSHLKLPDVAGVASFLRGGPLLLADRRLAEALEGIYHRGEIYLRWLQRLSALAFGTPAGRFLSKYVALPLGGAFVLLEGGQHLVNLLWHPLAHFELELMNPASLAFYAVLLLGLIHWPEFRRAFARAWGRIFRAVRLVLWGGPAWLFGLPPVQAVLASGTFRVLARAVLVPGALTALSWALMPRSVRHGEAAMLGIGSLYLALSLLLNTRVGRDLGESVADGLAWGLHRLRIGILPAAYRFIMDVFSRLLELIDRVLYAVDEWLRFRSGQGRAALVAKAALGLAWFLVAYAVRFCVNLLVEPQINPIKHFPVVTVSHKILLPFAPTARRLLLPLGAARATAITGTVFLLAPGVFGFLVWELKENWRLYEANRPPGLKPVLIGHHGETLVRLLRPGFHSGTVPKLFARLRRAEARALRRGRGKGLAAAREALHHVEEVIEHFAARELIALLNDSRALGRVRVAPGAVELASNRARVELLSPDFPGELAAIAFEEQAGWLVAGVAEPGWLDRLPPDGRRAIADALAGLYKMAGVDLVREQVEPLLGPGAPAYDVSAPGLVVWPGRDYQSEAVYDLRNGPLVDPLIVADSPVTPALPRLDRARVLFREAPLPWPAWVAAWEPGQHRTPLLDGPPLLPEPEAT